MIESNLGGIVVKAHPESSTMRLKSFRLVFDNSQGVALVRFPRYISIFLLVFFLNRTVFRVCKLIASMRQQLKRDWIVFVSPDKMEEKDRIEGCISIFS